MEIKRVWKIYFSPTGTTARLVNTIGDCLAASCGAKGHTYDFTLPSARSTFPELNETDLVVFGCPTYAGRLPNLLLPYLGTIAGNGASAIPLVTFGNRAFDNSLAELTAVMENAAFRTIAAAAFSCEHSFSKTLGAGRPDEADLKEAESFALAVFGNMVKSVAFCEPLSPIKPDGDPNAPYYKPQDRHGNFIDIRKVKPLTSDACTGCGLCAKLCPMGAIDKNDVRLVPGICIKCGACTKKCPQNAKYYDDAGYLYHKEELEAMYGSRRAENKFYL